MNDSLIFRVTARFMLPLLLLLTLFMVMRGHSQPGGGFIGGLLASSSLLIYMLAFGVDAARRALPFHYRALAPTGVTISAVSAMLSWFAGKPFQTGLWLPQPIPGVGSIGTPVIFDIGVCLTVLGVVALVAFTLAEAEEVEP